MTISILILFLLMVPFARADMSEVTNQSEEIAKNAGGIMLPLLLIFTSFGLMLDIFITIGIPIILMSKVFNKLKDPWRMVLTVASGVIMIILLETLTSKVGLGMAAWSIKGIYYSIIYYTYYLFRVRGDLSPVFVIFTQIACVNILYFPLNMVNLM